MSNEVDETAELEAEEERFTLSPEDAERRRQALRLVRQFGDPVLKTRALEVERFDDDLRREIERMAGLMDDAFGVGLAATQVGNLNRVFVYRVEPDSPTNVVINPVIEWSSKETETAEEGCLSLPAVHVDVERPLHVRVRAKDAFGDDIEIEASGLEARVIQHETDHLDGVLILDRISRSARKDAMRAMREAMEDWDTPAE
ncbi:MAG TPA: peptide deformylase [Baekduia sp.]|nr:peptide deformylase [Baekduia sp.]